MTTIKAVEDKLNRIFEKLVPDSGKADTQAGEIVCAICRIGYRSYNDGDRLGVGYGKETCNPAGRFLAKKCDSKVAECVGKAWGIYSDVAYDTAPEALENAVCEYLEVHPELRETPNAEDMWDWRDEYEDVDDDDEDFYD